MQKKSTMMIALTFTAVLASAFLRKENTAAIAEAISLDATILLQQRLKEAGVAENPMVTQYVSYYIAGITLYHVNYTDGSSEPLTAAVETEDLSEGGGMIYVCQGTQCNCRVLITFDSPTQYHLNCTCSPCVLEGHQIP